MRGSRLCSILQKTGGRRGVLGGLLKPAPLLQLSPARTFISKDFIVHSEYPDMEIPSSNIAPFITSKIGRFGDGICFEDGITGESYSFNQLIDKISLLSRGLAGLGLTPGDVLCIALPNCIQYPVLVLGGAAANLVVSPINNSYTATELAWMFEKNNAKVVATNAESYDKMKEALKDRPEVKIMIVDSTAGNTGGNNVITYEDVCRSGEATLSLPPTVEGSSMFLLPFSSGTTGRPKGVMLSHNNYVANILQLVPYELSKGVTSSVLIFPMYHAGGMKVWLECLYHGVKVVTLPSFNPDTYLNSLLTHRSEQLMLPPPLVQFLAKSDKATVDHLKDLRMVCVGAAPVGPALIQDFLKKAPTCQFREVWGMTELSAVGTMTSEEVVHGSCGKVVPNTQIKVVDLSTGANVQPGSQGEICIRGPQVMLGYFNNQVETDNTLREGWLHTGDIGYYDDSGNVYICDRLKELIKVKGFQVAPAELEDVIRSIPEVTDVAVIGIEDERDGEVPRAYVVSSSPGLTDCHVKDHVAQKLSTFKHLKGGVAFVKEIPKSAAGKILRKDLKAEFLQSGC